MSKSQPDTRQGAWIPICALAALIVPWSLVQAGKAIQEHRTADPQGEVEIVNVAGTVEVDAWDRSEVEVSGTAGDNVERVDVSSAGNRTLIHVVSRSAHMWGSGLEAHLVVHVPAKSAVMASLVSADFKVTGILGDLKVQSVSGNLKGDAGGNIRATIELTDVTRGRFKSVSGDMTAELALAPDGQLESESVSGDVSLKFAAAPAAEFDVQSISGDIRNCFGPKPTESRFGPGSRLEFKNGEGRARVRVNTKSGDVRLCAKDMNSTHVSMLSLARVREVRMVLPYVF
jgi:DUF4097 and DUF4098 domain-containing protein YvlB